MSSALVSVAKAVEYLGVEDPQEIPVIERLIDQVEALFLTQCHRHDRPFQAAQTARLETHDGTGTPLLFLDYPIAALVAVSIGPNPVSPLETLTIADVDVLRYATGRTRLHRVDGGTFGRSRDPRVVHVTYDTQADLPADAQVAVLRAVAAIYRQRGSEDATTERMGGYSSDLATVVQDDPTWQHAVRAHLELSFR